MKPFLLASLAPVALALAAAPIGASAADLSSTPVVATGNTLLTLTAEGRSTRAPDVAVFSAGVATSGKTAGEALAANAARMNAVFAALKRAGIADKDIQTSNLSLNPVYADTSREPKNALEQVVPPVIGYQVNNTVSVKQRKLGDFGKVIDTLVQAGANQVNGPSFEVDNADAALDEARAQAITAARTRAALYAKAAGLKVLRVLTINENGGYSPPRPVMYAKMAMADMAAPSPVAAGEVSLATSVTVLFELAP